MGKIAIIGGGVAGVTTALLLSRYKELQITLFEKKTNLIGGPPFCHLHAGGNLYREIDDAQCEQLLFESIEFAKLYSFCLDIRPTIIVVPKRDKGNPKDLLKRLEFLKNSYEKLIKTDTTNAILGDSKDYYCIYEKDDILKLIDKDIVKNPQNLDEWLIPFAKYVNLDNIKFPIIAINEFGINMFRFFGGVSVAIKDINNIDLKLNTKVKDIKKADKFKIYFNDNYEEFDYVINSAGFEVDFLDEKLGIFDERFIEFKAAYITKWDRAKEIKFPEIIFHGQRGASNGMAQFTPYKDGVFQLHGMTKNITLFEDGLVKNKNLPSNFIQKIEKGWEKDEVNQRTINAINHFKDLIPIFSQEAQTASIPLFGAQRIPGNNPDLRAAQVNIKQNYAKCEIVKVSSAINMVRAIEKDLKEKSIIKTTKPIDFNILKNIDIKTTSQKAKNIAVDRGYIDKLSDIVTPISQL